MSGNSPSLSRKKSDKNEDQTDFFLKITPWMSTAFTVLGEDESAESSLGNVIFQVALQKFVKFAYLRLFGLLSSAHFHTLDHIEEEEDEKNKYNLQDVLLSQIGILVKLAAQKEV